MEHQFDLDRFSKILTEKGYDGYFHTEGCCAGKLKDSIGEFLEAWLNGKEAPLIANYLHLSTYLKWNGEDKPKIECDIYVRYVNGKFDLQKTELYIRSLDRFGQLQKQSKLSKLTASSFPTLKEAIAQVSDKPKQQLSSQSKRFKI